MSTGTDLEEGSRKLNCYDVFLKAIFEFGDKILKSNLHLKESHLKKKAVSVDYPELVNFKTSLKHGAIL